MLILGQPAVLVHQHHVGLGGCVGEVGRSAADDVQHVVWEVQMRARSRARDARRRWATEHGLDANEAHRIVIGGGLPDYRDVGVFLVAIHRSIAGRIPPR